MSFAAWFACALLVVIVVQYFVIAHLLDERARVAAWLNEARADYGAEIARSKRMALRLLDGGASRGSAA